MCNNAGMRSLLAGLTSADIRLVPFPHIVVRDALAPAIYAALSRSYPPFSRIGWAPSAGQVPNNKRYEMLADAILDSPDMPACWKQFVALHSSPGFLAEMAALFRDHWQASMLAALGGSLEGHSSGRLSYTRPCPERIRQDARIEINTPVRDRPSTVRGAHLDTPNRLFSCLFYMRAEEDDSQGGDLVMFRWKSGPKDPIDRYELPETEVEPVLTIPYAANQLVVFPQTVHSIHGVAPRHPTPHMRRYVFITAQIEEPWLAVPGVA